MWYTLLVGMQCVFAPLRLPLRSNLTWFGCGGSLKFEAAVQSVKCHADNRIF